MPLVTTQHNTFKNSPDNTHHTLEKWTAQLSVNENDQRKRNVPKSL